MAQGTQTICSKVEGFVLRGSYLKQNTENLGIMLIFFFKTNINLPQLSYFLVLAAANAEYCDSEGLAFSVYLRVIRECQGKKASRKRSSAKLIRIAPLPTRAPSKAEMFRILVLIFPYKSFKFRTDSLALCGNGASPGSSILGTSLAATKIKVAHLDIGEPPRTPNI